MTYIYMFDRMVYSDLQYHVVVYHYIHLCNSCTYDYAHVCLDRLLTQTTFVTAITRSTFTISVFF